MKNEIQELSQRLIELCEKSNKKCNISIIDLNKSKHMEIISYVCKRVAELYSVELSDLKSWTKSPAEKQAKKMIVFLLINRLALPIKDVAIYLGMSSQSISYISLNPYSVYRIDNYEKFVYKIENELKEKLYLSS